MATTTVPGTLEETVAEDFSDRGTAFSNAPQNSGSSVTAGSELFIRRVLPFDVHDPVAASEMIALETVLATAPASELSIWRTVLIITTLAGLAFANSISVGLITIGLPVIATDLDLAQHLLLW
jgi:hypothetical protein